jgi:F-type H+-transporting ATPase subunit epsilon
MRNFHLTIVSMDGKFYDDEANQLSLQAIDGEVSIRAGHVNYLNAIGAGEARIYVDGEDKPRRASCIGGFLSVSKERVLVAATTFEWAEDIDIDRAREAKKKAESIIESKDSSANDIELAEKKLMRANVRIDVASNK